MEVSEDPLGPVKRHEKVVYVFNMSEDVWPFIQEMSGTSERQGEIEENANLADRELFSIASEESAIFISPKQIQPVFLEYYKKLFGVRDITILTPAFHSGLICEDIIADSSIMDALVVAANSVKKLTLISYSATVQFFSLVDALKRRGITVYTPESPEEDSAWAVNFFGSKSGIRQLAQKSVAREPDFMMADGVITTGIFDAAKIAANKYIKEDGVVIKTNKGHSGAGVLIFRKGDLPGDYRECERAIDNILHREGYWEKFPIVIESFLHINPSVAGGFPNVEFKISKSGKIEFLYYCGLRVMPNGVFKGVEINDEIITDRVAARIMDTGFYIGEQYVSAGYRGYFDVDYVATKNGEIFVTESNARRTGGTHVYMTALELIGKDFMSDTFVLSDNSYVLPNDARPSIEQVLDVLQSVLFDKKTKEGVVIASANLLNQGRLAYIIFGKNERHALEIEQKMESLLAQL